MYAGEFADTKQDADAIDRAIALTREKAKRLVAQAGFALVLAAIAAAVRTYAAQNLCPWPGHSDPTWVRCEDTLQFWIMALDLFQLLALGYVALLLRAVQIADIWRTLKRRLSAWRSRAPSPLRPDAD